MHELEPGLYSCRVCSQAAQVRRYYATRDLRLIEARQPMSESCGRCLYIHLPDGHLGDSRRLVLRTTFRPPPAEPA